MRPFDADAYKHICKECSCENYNLEKNAPQCLIDQAMYYSKLEDSRNNIYTYYCPKCGTRMTIKTEDAPGVDVFDGDGGKWDLFEIFRDAILYELRGERSEE